MAAVFARSAGQAIGSGSIRRRAPTAGESHNPPPVILSDQLDPTEQRQRSVEFWEEASAGWIARQAAVRHFTAPISNWMIEAVQLQPGERVLELAAGLGETGLLASELVAPAGEVIISDQAQGMLDGARARARELGAKNVRFELFGAEWIDLPVAAVDVVLCRFGYMLMADPLTALTETRRVLRPGGRLALAVWDELAANPWAQAPALELAERGHAPPAVSGQQFQPGPFALGDADRLNRLLEQAGLTEIAIQGLELQRRHRDFEDFWQTTLDLSRTFHDAVLERPEAEIAEIRAALAERLARFGHSDGELAIPARVLVAHAQA